VGPSQIHHLDQERAVIVSGRVLPQKLKWKDGDFKKFLDGIPRPKGISLGLAGERAMIKESFWSLGFTLVLAVVLIYMIMASQFESLWQPFIIMFSLPLALIGVALSLFLSGMSLNIISFLGIILLGGIAVNNGIVLVSCMDQYAQEMPLEEAVVKGSVRRLRPVLMTTLTTIVGLIPLSLGWGKGAELRSPMAMAVMGGLVSSTILTLFIIPALYLMGKKINR
jgi:HAE1 family hydrophobic/amphiphilic exporter-1